MRRRRSRASTPTSKRRLSAFSYANSPRYLYSWTPPRLTCLRCVRPGVPLGAAARVLEVEPKVLRRARGAARADLQLIDQPRAARDGLGHAVVGGARLVESGVSAGHVDRR